MDELVWLTGFFSITVVIRNFIREEELVSVVGYAVVYGYGNFKKSIGNK